jgi:putative endonuclease
VGASVYILKCADRSYYVGCADDLERRISEHQQGCYGGYTSTRRPVELMWSSYFDRVTDAHAAERQIKGWSRSKKEALIRSDWARVSALAKRRGGRSKPPTQNPSS